MRKLQSLVFSLAAFGSTGLANDRPQVIYGDDNRQEVVNPKQAQWAKATVALFNQGDLQKQPIPPFASLLPDTTLGEAEELCPEERFFDQPNGAFCSGFLISPQQIITAGHCVADLIDCQDTAFVFDYIAKGDQASIAQQDRLYQCKDITLGEDDFAIITLDRPTEGRQPLKLRKRGKVSDKKALIALGYPSGLPLKVIDQITMRDNQPRHHFVVNADTYVGNSGTPVINPRNGMVEGMIVRGERDWEWDEEAGCHRSKRCAEGECRGEDVLRATHMVLNPRDHAQLTMGYR